MSPGSLFSVDFQKATSVRWTRYVLAERSESGFSAYLNLALTRLDADDVGRRRARDDWFARLVFVAHFVDEAHGVMLDKALEHIAHAVGRFLLVSHDGRVVAVSKHELQPRHIDLRSRRAAPLSRLQQYEAYGHTSLAHVLEHGY